MKKIIALFVILVAFTVGSVIVLRTPSNILYLLNWGEYIDQDLVKEFEKEYNCQVVEEDVVSSEIMYQKITSGTTSYDVAIPGDYTVRQLYKEGYLNKLDVNNLNYKSFVNYETMFTDSLKNLMNTYMIDEATCESIETYFMPYFWGAYSIIYSENKPDVESVIKEKGFEALYNRSLYQEDVKIGMYDTARWIVASYLLANGLNPNISTYELDATGNAITTGDLAEELKDDIVNALKINQFDAFQNDQLKRDVARGSLDMCYSQLGDFFDALYLSYDQNGDDASINFNVYVPENSAAFFDSMVIPTTCQNYDLANAFIDFMLNPEHAYQNAQSIGYCPTLKAVCDLYRTDALNGAYYYESDGTNSLTLAQFLDKYPMYLNPLYNAKDYYLLDPKSNDYLTTCETIFNNLA